ncbi:MAG: NADH-quinone oxidoreductase subunit C [Steroidobacteraceae bacterium]
MALQRWFHQAYQQSGSNGVGVVAGAPKVLGLMVSRDEWQQAAEHVATGGGRLQSLWASRDQDGRDRVRVAYTADQGVLVLSLPLLDGELNYPGIEQWFPSAGRMQRAVADLSGLRSTDPDMRPWLRHAAWPESFHPLVEIHTPPSPSIPIIDRYAFIPVEGEGVHEIPVGPVHAGIIEPGHFRFSVVGEKVLRLEERLGYVHKGIERRFTEFSLLNGHRLAARISGDSAVAYSWAYCQALEGMTAAHLPDRAAGLRALALELERVANHLGDLGAIANDAGFSFGLSQFSRLKEQLLRATEQALGQRYLMDFVVPGGTRVDLSSTGIRLLVDSIESIAPEVKALHVIYDDHAGLRDRFVGAGIVTPTLAAQLGLTGLAGRASGQAFDLRCDLPCDPFSHLAPKKIVQAEGDVAARVAVRFDEVMESARLLQQILRELPAGPHQVTISAPDEGALGVGMIEGWRGPIFLALDAGVDGMIRRCHPHDPSWQNWPVIEHAIIDNIVPDFPLINKSFNLSYSGHDL